MSENGQGPFVFSCKKWMARGYAQMVSVSNLKFWLLLTIEHDSCYTNLEFRKNMLLWSFDSHKKGFCNIPFCDEANSPTTTTTTTPPTTTTRKQLRAETTRRTTTQRSKTRATPWTNGHWVLIQARLQTILKVNFSLKIQNKRKLGFSANSSPNNKNNHYWLSSEFFQLSGRLKVLRSDFCYLLRLRWKTLRPRMQL